MPHKYPVADCIRCNGFLLYSPLWDEWQHADTRSRTCKTGTVAVAVRITTMAVSNTELAPTVTLNALSGVRTW